MAFVLLAGVDRRGRDGAGAQIHADETCRRFTTNGMVAVAVVVVVLQLRICKFAYLYRQISATPRQLESLIRLSEALARMRLAPEVITHTLQQIDEHTC
jgi:hypothetical protein